MHTFGARLAMSVNAQDNKSSPMAPSNQSSLMGHLKNGALMPLPRTAAGKEYIIVGIDYMNRWVEAAPTSKITAKDVAKLLFENICCRSGTHLEI